MPTFLSTFSGIGGIDLGLERAGWRCVGQAEQDPYRRAVLAHHFPGVECAEDVRVLVGGGVKRDRVRGGESRASWGESWSARSHPDLLCGGFPCQDLSVAGRRAGLAGERSGLFFEFARIADAVRPRWLLIENVPGLLSSNGGRDFGELLGTLADLGYGVAWRILDSRFFGVPQRRRRVFIVGSDLGGRAGAERAGAVLAVGSRCDGHPAAGEQEGPGVAACAEDGVASPLGGVRRGQPTAEQAAGGHVVVNALTRNGVGAGGGPDDNAAQAGHLVPVGFHITQDPISAENLSLPLRFKSTGNGVFTGGAQQDQFVEPGGVVPTLAHSYCTHEGHHQPKVIGAGAVRRLTPVECERLQGFPDEWTNIAWNGKAAPDSRRYAALGDAVTVPVAEWLGRRLVAA